MICNEAIKIIKHFESLHDGDLTQIGLQPKRCPAGIWTVGYGHALKSADGLRWLDKESDKEEAYSRYPHMTVDEAEELLEDDLDVFEKRVENVVLVRIDDNQRGALVSLCYNIGIGNFKKSTLLALVNDEKFDLAAHQFLRWNKCNGEALQGLTLRRERETILFLS